MCDERLLKQIKEIQTTRGQMKQILRVLADEYLEIKEEYCKSNDYAPIEVYREYYNTKCIKQCRYKPVCNLLELCVKEEDEKKSS